MTKRDLALDLFKLFKTGATRKPNKPAPTKTIGQTGDPELIGNLVSNMIQEREWNSGLAEGNLFITWAAVVGAEIAQHATPISILDSTLTIQTSSTAWATQLNLVADNLLATIQADPSGATIEKLRFIGPNAPSWKKGVRTIRNARGVRDTYG
jgi:predicted nucleic acid-binding Zn ribbon protein